MYKQYGDWMRRMGTKRDDNYRIMSKPMWALWFIYQFYVTVMVICLFMLPFMLYADIGTLEETWTDFSPQEELDYVERNDEEEKIDKDKYRIYFEDKELVIMVLGGLDWWQKKCGTLSGAGNYFMNLAMEKHNIILGELTDDMTFQTGHFAAALYNDCDVFLEQTQSIGLDMMLEKTPQPELETVDNLSDSEA